MNTIKYMYNKTSGLLCALCLLCVLCVTSCEDMLDKGNEYVIYADDQVISDPADTVTSVLGILNKLQGIAVRNNLFGELRADLVTVNDNATTDLKSIASLEINDSNVYNLPRDYYAVINNCNFFLERADSTAGNTNRNEKYFEAEIAQVHSIRAWTYLQMVLLYGKVPFVIDPVITKLQSDASYPMYDLDQICDYFIQDLKPYYGKEYPDYGGVGGNVDPQMCFFPTQVVTGDLYLWLAAKRHDPEMAKLAAKAYYDYIVWDLSGKRDLVTNNNRVYWNEQSLYTGRLNNPSGGISYGYSGVWGRSDVESVTVIPMDSAASDGYYNDLRNLYNTQYNIDYVEASIAPSSVLRDLSKAQRYIGYDNYKSVVEVTADKFTDEEINEGYLGDLRFYDNYTQRTTKWNGEEIDYQTIYKHNFQHIGIYRAAQIYLRLAEALNYAGYPRFARQILIMGLSNTVIENEVQPYYTSAQDSAFIQYFDFNNNDFKPYAESYALSRTPSGVIRSYTPTLRGEIRECNMWGIHSRGSGLAFLNTDYAPLEVIDSNAVSNPYPYALEDAIGVRPTKADYEYPAAPRAVVKPSTWDKYPNQVVDHDTYVSINPTLTTSALERAYKNYVEKDSVGAYNVYVTVTVPEYEAAVAAVDLVYQTDFDAYTARSDAFLEAYWQWYKVAYANPTIISNEQLVIDRLILDEQALELCFEGNRFYDLMRRALWYNDPSRLATPVSQRDATVGAKLMNRNNWYIQWKDKIGPNVN